MPAETSNVIKLPSRARSEWEELIPGFEFAIYRQSETGQCEIDCFAVPEQRYAEGCKTGAIVMKRLLEVIEVGFSEDRETRGVVSSVARDAARNLGQRGGVDEDSRRGAAVGFLAVLDALIVDSVQRGTWHHVMADVLAEYEQYEKSTSDKK
jgi:hypothetical protein